MGKKYRAVNKGIVIRANWAIIWKSCETSSFSLEPSENDDFIMVLKNQICEMLTFWFNDNISPSKYHPVLWHNNLLDLIPFVSFSTDSFVFQ